MRCMYYPIFIILYLVLLIKIFYPAFPRGIPQGIFCGIIRKMQKNLEKRVFEFLRMRQFLGKCDFAATLLSTYVKFYHIANTYRPQLNGVLTWKCEKHE